MSHDRVDRGPADDRQPGDRPRRANEPDWAKLTVRSMRTPEPKMTSRNAQRLTTRRSAFHNG